MDDQGVEEDPYSDEDLDYLPGNTFSELEQTAFQSTQRTLPQLPVPKAAHIQSPQRPSPASVAGGLGRLSVVANAAHAAQAQNQNGGQYPSSDYGDLDDEMLDGEIFDANERSILPAAFQQHHVAASHLPDESTLREQWRQQRYSESVPPVEANSARPNGMNPPLNGPFPPTEDRTARRPTQAPPLAMSDRFPAQPKDDLPLRTDIMQLLKEKEELLQLVREATDTANAKVGEIAIVRANASRLEKEFDDRNKALENMNKNEASRHKSELEKTKSELQKLVTEKRFLENEVSESTKQIRNLQRTVKKAAAFSENAQIKDAGASTPKRQRLGLGDGFNDDEILPQSPSKLVHRAKPSTPKAGSKRKRRPADESPIRRSLDFEQHFEDDPFDVQEALPDAPAVLRSGDGGARSQMDLIFMQEFLNRGFQGSSERSIEVLAGFHIPSEPKVALSTMLLDRLAPPNLTPNGSNLPAAIALEVIALWRKCIGEGYHEPVHLFLDLVHFSLGFKPYQIAPELTNDLMSLLQETADIIIIPRCQKKPPRKDRAGISSTSCLETVDLMATALFISADEAQRFWKTMRFDFLMMLLSFINPLPELHLIVRILRTSVLSNTFAMIIPPNDGKQDTTEAHVIDNLSRLLVEPPRPSQNEITMTGEELANLRLAILALVEDMAANDYAAMVICKHKLLLGRIVRLMNDSLAGAYDDTPARPKLIELVNQGTRLFYYFMINHAEYFNLQEKLSVIPGGEKKFLIVLTRLAFTEGVYIEAGIEDDVSDLAHRMLEDRVSPEEAEGLVAVMSTAPTTRAPTMRQESMSEAAEEVQLEDDHG